MAIETVTRTIYSAHLSTCKLLNKPFTILPNSTLNQKYSLYKDEVPNSNEYPKLGYIGIGNKGSSYEVTSTGYVLTTPIPHSPRHASLYNQIPFLIRPIDDDISSTERAKYRLRVPISLNNNTYIAYYLRTLDLTSVTPVVQIRNVNNGVITTNTFTPTTGDLAPVAPNLNNINLNDPSGDYLVSTALVNFTLSATDITNIREACQLLYGDQRYAVINEIALVTGVDKILSGVAGSNGSINYTETIAAQVASFISSEMYILTENNQELTIQLDLGSVEPLLF